MTFNDYEKTVCLEFDYIALSSCRYEYFIKYIDKSGHSMKLIYFTYDFNLFNLIFKSSNFTDPLILLEIEHFLIKGIRIEN